MKVLVTAGNTQTPIDYVRCITNMSTGLTGARIAVDASGRGHTVTLFTNHSSLFQELIRPVEPWKVEFYRTFDDLSDLMEESIPGSDFDVIIHAAAVSDYTPAGIYAPSADTAFTSSPGAATVDAQAGKIKSNHPELWLRLVPTPKLVDRIREPWGFRGTLVKFKLEVGLAEQELLAVAERSRTQSLADLMVANTLEEMNECAYIGPGEGRYIRVPRKELASKLLDQIETIHALKK